MRVNLLYTSTVCRIRDSCSTTVLYSLLCIFIFPDIKSGVDLARSCEYYTWHMQSPTKIPSQQPPCVFSTHAASQKHTLNLKSIHMQTHSLILPMYSLNWSWVHILRGCLLNRNAFRMSFWQGQRSLYPVCWLSCVRSLLASLGLTSSLKSLSAWSRARLNKGYVRLTPESVKWERG